MKKIIFAIAALLFTSVAISSCIERCPERNTNTADSINTDSIETVATDSVAADSVVTE